MKQMITVLTVILAIPCLVIGQVKNKRSESDEKTVLRIERELSDGLINNSDAPFEKHLADAFVCFPPFGEMLNKSRMIQMVKYDSRQTESSQHPVYKIQSNGRTAVVAYRSNDLGFFKFVDVSGQFEWVDVFEKRQGNWQLMYRRGAAIH